MKVYWNNFLGMEEDSLCIYTTLYTWNSRQAFYNTPWRILIMSQPEYRRCEVVLRFFFTYTFVCQAFEQTAYNWLRCGHFVLHSTKWNKELIIITCELRHAGLMLLLFLIHKIIIIDQLGTVLSNYFCVVNNVTNI